VVGDVVSLSGVLSAKVGEPWRGRDGNERRSVEFALRFPRIAPVKPHNGPSGAVRTFTATNLGTGEVRTSQGQWDTHDETPF